MMALLIARFWPAILGAATLLTILGAYQLGAYHGERQGDAECRLAQEAAANAKDRKADDARRAAERDYDAGRVRDEYLRDD